MKIAILGAGKFGVNVIEALLDGGHDITLVDLNTSRLDLISKQYDVLTYVGDIRTVDVLEQIEISSFDFLLSCTSSDDVNIIAASNAKALGCQKVAARMSEPDYTHQYDFICRHYGIDAIVNPNIILAEAIYNTLIEKCFEKPGKHKVMIIGGGRSGFYLADKLSSRGDYVKLIEVNEDRCRYLCDHLHNVMVLHGRGTDIALLEEEDFTTMDAFVTATGSDEEDLLMALTARDHGVKNVISKVKYSSYNELAEKLGIDALFNPMTLSATEILRIISEDK
ncbi:MAG: NAD-binding protein [Clostridiales bacterium]|nr:NAD-binding protein [Candidatus Crickella caballi]